MFIVSLQKFFYIQINMHYCFIINNAPSKALNVQKITNQIEHLGTAIDYEIYKTTAVRSTTEFVCNYCRTNPDREICFVACGGDGTINETATGMMMGGTSNKHLAVLAYGSGNDFVKYYPDKDFRNIDNLLLGQPHDIDIMKIDDSHYSINVCNIGFDSIVGRIANNLNHRGWKCGYRLGVLYAILTSMRYNIDLMVDGERINEGKQLFHCTLGNNNHVGNEFCCSPYACNNDGLIEVGVCKTCTRIKFFMSLIHNYRKGTHLDNPKTRKYFIYRRAHQIDIHSHKPIDLVIDGELLPGQDFHVEIIPQAINLIIPA